MGGIWSRIRGKKTTYEILENIDKDISRLQKSRKENQDRLKQIVTRLIISSVILYIVGAVLLFFLYLPDTWKLRALYSLPLLAFPALIWGLKKLLHWYFVSRIAKNDNALIDLREKKKQLLEDVMENETYKKAKEILEKFDPARFKKLEENPDRQPSPQGTPGTVLQQRALPRPMQTPMQTPMGTPLRPQGQIRPGGPMVARQGLMQQGTPMRPMMNTPNRAPMGRGGTPMPMRNVGPPGPPMPRSVLPRERGAMDKLMDYLVGDGPDNRMALICVACHSHNGMALREEFDYLSFRCCYCFYMNPARKQRPFAPRMEFFNPANKFIPKASKEESESDGSEEDASSEDEGKEVLMGTAAAAAIKAAPEPSPPSDDNTEGFIMASPSDEGASMHTAAEGPDDPTIATSITTIDSAIATQDSAIATSPSPPPCEDQYVSDSKDSNYESEFSELSEKISDGSDQVDDTNSLLQLQHQSGEDLIACDPDQGRYNSDNVTDTALEADGETSMEVTFSSFVTDGELATNDISSIELMDAPSLESVDKAGSLEPLGSLEGFEMLSAATDEIGEKSATTEE